MQQVFIVLTLFFIFLLTPFLKKRPKWMMAIAGVGVAFVVALVLGVAGTFLGQNDDDLSTPDLGEYRFRDDIDDSTQPPATLLERQLFGALLTVEDLPAGWSISYQSPFSLEAGVIGGVEVRFTDDFGRAVEEVISVTERGVAASVMDAFTAQPCYEFTEDEATFQTCSVHFPAFGEQTAAQVGTTESVLGVNEFAFVSIRRGDVLTVIGYIAPEVDMDWMKTLVRRADEKLAALEATGAAINR